jgi:hypothetical protein
MYTLILSVLLDNVKCTPTYWFVSLLIYIWLTNDRSKDGWDLCLYAQF